MSQVNLAEKFKIPTPQKLDPNQPVLVVEDQQDMRLIVVHHLNKLNFRSIHQVTNGYDALELMNEIKNFSVIISDMDMPVMGGLDFLGEIRDNQKYSRGPFCLAMDNVSKEKLMLAVETGVDEVLVKPFTLGDIMPKMATAFKVFHNPKNPEKVYELAKSLFRDGKLDESHQVYKALADAAPKAARPLVGLARIALGQKNHDDALKFLADAEKNNPNFVHLYTARGDLYAEKSMWEEAITAYKKAIDLSPLNPARYKAAVDVLFKQSRFQDALNLLEMALKNGLDFKDLHHFLSQAYFAVKAYDKAIKHIRTALGNDPENVTYLNQLGISYKESDNFEEANKIYNQIIKIDPENLPALYNKAVMLNSRGDTAEAIKILDRVVKKYPEFSQAKSKLEEYKKSGTKGAA